MKVGTQRLLDRFSIGASVVCAVHCVAMPVVLAFFPAIASLTGDEHTFHLLLVWLVLPSSLLAGTLGCAKHKDVFVLLGIFVGLVLLVGTAYLGHDLLGELGEKVATVAATSLLAVAHWRNYMLCRRRDCEHGEALAS
ncbi:MAG: MerC domain-containing protein [Pseudomonadota bacterium]